MSQNLPVPVAEPIKRSKQNKAMGEYITEAGVLLATALTDANVAAKLAARSYDAAKIGAGVALQGAAQAAYNGRQSGLGDREGAVDEQTTMFAEERAEFEAFRTLARPIFTGAGARTAMNLSGTVPQDMAEFVAFARAGYTGAKAAEFQIELAPLGFGVAQLDAELAELQTFQAMMSGRQSAGGEAKAATGDRNTAFRNLKAWMDRFEGVAKIALGTDLYKLPFDELPN
ncbi:MAG TPA: hypothetical protein VF627_14845, partial [Abditibacterium sp.]